MTRRPLYQSTTVLDRDTHRELRLRPAEHLRFAADTTRVPIVVGEFVELARQCPIAFLHDATLGWVPVALLGLPGGGNVYLDDEGRWSAPYLPAFLRRYPFIFAETGPDQLSVCIDRAYEGFGEVGERLFTPDGEPAELTRQALALLSEFQRQHLLTREFVGQLVAAGLLTEVRADARLADGRSLALGGLAIVDEQKLRALPDATLANWVRSGALTFVHAHLMSLGTLLELLRRTSAVAVDGPPAPPVEAATPATTPAPGRRRAKVPKAPSATRP